MERTNNKSEYFSLPFILIYSRLISAAVVLIIPCVNIERILVNYGIVLLMLLAILSDIFDGVIARKMGISSEKLRLWDSNVDQIFWFSTMAVIFYLNDTFILDHWIEISIVIILEILAYIICMIKFKKLIATHSILAKIFTLSLFIFLADLILHNQSNVIFYICLILAFISRLEILIIIIRLKAWAMDVPSIFAVSNLNEGKPIKKNKLFNG